MNSIFFRDIGLHYYSIVLNTGEKITASTRLLMPGALSNITLITKGSVKVITPNKTSYTLNASDTPVDMSKLMPGCYEIIALTPVNYTCVGPLPTQLFSGTPCPYIHRFIDSDVVLTRDLFPTDKEIILLDGILMKDGEKTPVLYGTRIGIAELSTCVYSARSPVHVAVLT